VPGQGTVRDYPRLKHGGQHLGERENEVGRCRLYRLQGRRAGFIGWLGWRGAVGASAGCYGKRQKSPKLARRRRFCLECGAGTLA
jgi:peptide/nickel transport system permease protein